MAALGEDFRPFFLHMKDRMQTDDEVYVQFSSRYVFSYNALYFGYLSSGHVIPKIEPFNERRAQAYVEEQTSSGRSWWFLSGRTAGTKRIRDSYFDALWSRSRILSVQRSNEGILVECERR